MTTKSKRTWAPLQLRGMKFGRLRVIRKVEQDNQGNFRWLCVCDHDDPSRRPKRLKVSGFALKNGNTKSCGCLARERAVAHGKSFRRHGLHNDPLYWVWHNMKRRCLDPKRKEYKHYGGRGIKVCREWLVSDNFFAWAKATGYKRGLSVERRDNDLNYCPGNCYWLPHRLQGRNKRNTIRIVIDGIRTTLVDQCERMGLRYKTVLGRMYAGWTVEDALHVPIKHRSMAR